MRSLVIVPFFLFILTTKVYSQPIHLVTNPFPPLHMTVSNNGFGKGKNVTGIATDIISELFLRSNIEYTITLHPSMKKSLEKVTSGENYGIYTTFKTLNRIEQFKWVGPLFEEDWIILAPKERNIIIHQLDDLNEYRVGSYEQDEISKHLTRRGINLIKAKGDVVNAAKLKLGKIDLWATSSLSGPVIAKRYNMRHLEIVYKFNRASLWIALNKKVKDETVSVLNQYLRQLREEGYVDSIIKKYTHPDII